MLQEGSRRAEPDYSLDYTYTDIQSSLAQPSLEPVDMITVTHQVPTRTIFTVVERGQTKSLFAEVLETSLEVRSGQVCQVSPQFTVAGC